jgi:hypothetical protein
MPTQRDGWRFCRKFFPVRLVDGTRSGFFGELMRRVAPDGTTQYREATEHEIQAGRAESWPH